MARKQVGMIDADLLARVDEARGDVPRTKWLERVLRRELDRAESNGRAIAVAVEEASGGGAVALGSGGAARQTGAPPDLSGSPASPRQPQVYRCPLDCNPSWRPTSESARCSSCGRKVVPA